MIEYKALFGEICFLQKTVRRWEGVDLSRKQKVPYLRWIYGKVRRRVPVLVFAAILTASISYAGIQFSLTAKAVINNAIAGDSQALTGSCLMLLGLSLFCLLGNLLSQILGVNMREGLERDFKHSILHHILNCDYSAISGLHSGDLIQRMDGDASTVYGGVMGFSVGIVGLITSLVTAVAALLQIAPGFTIAFGVVGLILGSTTFLFRKMLKKLSKDSSRANGVVMGFLHESISKLMVIQALDVSREVERRTDDVLDQRWVIRRKQRNVQALSRFGFSVITSASYLVTMVWCAWKLRAGVITYGDVTAMVSLVSTVRSAATALPQSFPRLFAIGAACERIMELENLPIQTEPDPEKTRKIYETMSGFTAEHLSFAYDRELVMKDVSITVPKGGLTVIVGQSGIGKSTLLKLLLGLYRPNSGTLVIDTTDGTIPVDRGTRSLFSYAPQGNFLLSGTLRENLTFTNPNATDEEIQAALYVSAMDEYVASLPEGLETVLRENGAGLSEGQAQRISLARAILSGAPVLLLDEVTSALDAVTEQTVLERITALPGKTCIAVTHRPAALALATHVIEVTEEGMTISRRN